MSRFSTILHALRTQQGLTQKQLADRLGVSLSTISMYERGHRQPDLDTLSRLAAVFGVSMDTFFEEDAPKTPSEVKEDKTVQVLRKFAEERNLPYDAVLRWFSQGDSPSELTLRDSTGQNGYSLVTGTPLTRQIMHLTPHEQAVIAAYRRQPEVRPFVDKLLDVKDK